MARPARTRQARCGRAICAGSRTGHVSRNWADMDAQQGGSATGEASPRRSCWARIVCGWVLASKRHRKRELRRFVASALSPLVPTTPCSRSALTSRSRRSGQRALPCGRFVTGSPMNGTDARARTALWTNEQSADYLANGFGSPEDGPLTAGESVGVVNGIEPASELVRRLAAEAETILSARTTSLLS